MMLICAWPSAGPTGGAGVALPASICNLTDVCTFFGAICRYPDLFFYVTQALPPVLDSLRYFLYLPKLQLDRGCAAENRDHHLERLAIFVDLVHGAIEVGERPIGNSDSLVLLELHPDLGFVLAYGHPIDNLVD